MLKTKKIALGIETSCDDTSIALLAGDVGGAGDRPQILAMHHFNEEALFNKWGGVVPEIAARNHLAKLAPLLEKAFKTAKVGPHQVDIIGITTHPGLLGPLLTGLNAAKTLSLIHQTPLVPVNHLYAHLEAIHLVKKVPYPYLGLVASGGHSLFLLVSSSTEFEVLGTTLDDAAGEAFDKGGKLLGLGYPAGQKIDELAGGGDPFKYTFPIGLASSGSPDLSFSGVKTSLRMWIERHGRPSFDSQEIKDLCAGYQEAIVRALELKAHCAFKFVQKKIKGHIPLVVGGGVACNSRLREVLSKAFKGVLFIPPQFCTDNAGMVGNYALRAFEKLAIFFPDTLLLDARGKFIKKNQTQGI